MPAPVFPLSQIKQQKLGDKRLGVYTIREADALWGKKTDKTRKHKEPVYFLLCLTLRALIYFHKYVTQSINATCLPVCLWCLRDVGKLTFLDRILKVFRFHDIMS